MEHSPIIRCLITSFLPVQINPNDAGDGQVLVRTLYLSLDPTNRIWMSDMDQYMPPVEIGEIMRGGTIGVVEASGHDGMRVGDIVQGMWGWQSHAVIDGRAARVLPRDSGLPLTAYMSVLGGTGCTAYFGLLDIGQPQPGETVVVSAAAGATSSVHMSETAAIPAGALAWLSWGFNGRVSPNICLIIYIDT